MSVALVLLAGLSDRALAGPTGAAPTTNRWAVELRSPFGVQFHPADFSLLRSRGVRTLLVDPATAPPGQLRWLRRAASQSRLTVTLERSSMQLARSSADAACKAALKRFGFSSGNASCAFQAGTPHAALALAKRIKGASVFVRLSSLAEMSVLGKIGPADARVIAVVPFPNAASVVLPVQPVLRGAADLVAATPALGLGLAPTSRQHVLDFAGIVFRSATAKPPASAPAPTSAPTSPTVVSVTAAQDSVTLAWHPSVGLAPIRYEVARDGAPLSTATTTTLTLPGLACGTTYRVTVSARDASGKLSAPAIANVGTMPCATGGGAAGGPPTSGGSGSSGGGSSGSGGAGSGGGSGSSTTDTTPPTAPTGLAVSATTASSLSVSWGASSDNVGVTAYRLFVAGAPVGTASATGYTFGSLACNTSYSLAVAAVDAAGNVSVAATLTTSTAPCFSGSSGANIYVAQGAAGSGDGSSCANAKPASFFNTPANWGVGKPVAPGATVGLCGSISSQLVAQGNGAAGSPVTILFQAGAKLSEPVCPWNGCLNMNGRSYVTVDGGTNGIVESTDNGTTLGHQSAAVGIDAESCMSCTIENLTIQNMYVHTGSGSEVDNSSENCMKISGSNWQVHNNTLHDASWCIWDRLLAGDTGVHIHDNNIYNVDHGAFIGGTDGQSVGDIWFNNNHVHDMANWDAANNAYHHDGVHCFTNGTTGLHFANFLIYNNVFDGDPGAHATSWVFLEGSPQGTACNDASSNIWVFNNKAISSNHSTANDVLLASNGNVFFANNTIDQPDPSQGTCLGLIATGTYVNNAIGGCNQLVHGSSATRLDYNAYAHCSGSFNCFWVGGVDTAIFATYQAAGYEAHSVANLGAATGSNGSGVGTNLTAYCSGDVVPLCSDINGVARPATGSWNAGAGG